MRLLLPLAGLVLITFAACAGDDDPGGGGSGGGTTSSGSGGSTTSSGSGGSISSGSGGSTTSSGSGGSISSSGFGGGDICDADPNDDACITCTRASCCTELEACILDAPCICLLECFMAGTDPPLCLGECPSSTAVNTLAACAAGQCTADCV